MASTLTPEMRELVNTDPFFERSCLSGKTGNIVIHHAIIYAGKQINEKWAIVPLLWSEHDAQSNNPKAAHRCQETRDRIELICLDRATDEELAKYPNRDWKKRKKLLAKRFIKKVE